MMIPVHKISGLKEGDDCPTLNENGYKCKGVLVVQNLEGGWRLECPECGYQGEYVGSIDLD